MPISFSQKMTPKPKRNTPVLNIAQIIKTVMASAAEDEMAALSITAKNMIPLRNKLIEMCWPEPHSPTQTDNSTTVGFTNKIIVKKATKSTDMRLWWLRDRESQDQFRYYLSPGY